MLLLEGHVVLHGEANNARLGASMQFHQMLHLSFTWMDILFTFYSNAFGLVLAVCKVLNRSLIQWSTSWRFSHVETKPRRSRPLPMLTQFYPSTPRDISRFPLATWPKWGTGWNARSTFTYVKIFFPFHAFTSGRTCSPYMGGKEAHFSHHVQSQETTFNCCQSCMGWQTICILQK